VGLLFPLRDWWTDRSWLRSWLGVFLLAAIGPFALLHATDTCFRDSAWAFAGYFPLIWLLVIHVLVQPGRIGWWLTARVALLTMVFGVAAAIWVEWALRHVAGHGLAHNVVGVGLVEESAKALPILLLVYLGGRRLSPKACLYLGAVSGLGFGVAEAVGYSGLYRDSGFSPSSRSVTRLFGKGSAVLRMTRWRRCRG
jgi:RsiW-degrading membrane proteinase PrsW (M82 family)